MDNQIEEPKKPLNWMILYLALLVIGQQLAGIGGAIGGVFIAFGLNRVIRNPNYPKNKKILYSILYAIGGVVMALVIAFGLTLALRYYFPTIEQKPNIESTYQVPVSTSNNNLEEPFEIGGQKTLKKSYPNYGFSLFVPERFKSRGSHPEINGIDSFDEDIQTSAIALDIYVYSDNTGPSFSSSEEYKINSQKNLSKNRNTQTLTYVDGGILTNRKGVKLYYDIISGSGDDGITRTTKKISLYHNSNLISILFTDSSKNYPNSVKEFDSIVNTISVY